MWLLEIGKIASFFFSTNEPLCRLSDAAWRHICIYIIHMCTHIHKNNKEKEAMNFRVWALKGLEVEKGRENYVVQFN